MGPTRSGTSVGTDGGSASEHQVDVVMDAARVLNSIVARSLQALEPTVTLVQLRVLVMLSMQGPLNLASVASGLDVHPSNATRVCSRLVELGLVERRNRESDRRNVELTLTAAGRRAVRTVTRRRRAAVADILALLPEASRRRLVASLHEFTEASAELSDSYAMVLEGHTVHP